MEKNRITWLDDTRGLCVFCVLLAHSGIVHTYLYKTYTPFFLTGFFFISGFLYKNINFKQDILKILKHLVIPYFLLNLVVILIGFDNWKALFHGNTLYITEKLRNTLLGYNMWFIPCIIMVQLYVTILHYTFMKNLLIKILITFVLMLTVYFIRNENSSIMPWYADIALFSSGFFLFGNIIKSIYKFSDWLPNFNTKKSIAIGILFIYVILSYFLQYRFNMEFHYAYNYYEMPLLFILLSICGILSICIFFQSFHSKFLSILGQNSLTFFAFNGKAKAIALILLPKIPYIGNNLTVLILCFIEAIVLIIISYFINRFCPFIIGKYNIK